MSGLYVPVLPPEGIIPLVGEEFHHGIRSLRHKVGEKVWLTDGQGHIAEGIIVQIGKASAEVQVLCRYEKVGEPPALVALLVSPLKQPARMDWLVEKAVELGATTIYFVPMSRSSRSTVNLSRLEKVALAAVKQNLRSVIPAIHALSSWEEVPWASFPLRLMGEIGAQQQLIEALPPQPLPVLWIVGPEGDFTEEELHLLRQKACVGVTLGQLRLRAETAALLFLSTVKSLWGY
jgi:16S rRNA (uracil1498-N3)-methyltransferase